MSKEGGSKALSLVFIEKISGLLLLIIGVTLAYNSILYLNDLGVVGTFSIIVGATLTLLGTLMIAAKSE